MKEVLINLNLHTHTHTTVSNCQYVYFSKLKIIFYKGNVMKQTIHGSTQRLRNVFLTSQLGFVLNDSC